MKSKNKRYLKLATTFLKDLKTKSSSNFERISELLEKYDSCEIDSSSVLKGIVKQIQSNGELVNSLNQFLDHDHRVKFISFEQSQEMITYIFEIIQKMTNDYSKFDEFLNLIAKSSEKMDEMKISSLSEVGDFIMNEVRSWRSAEYWGADFITLLENSINSFLNSSKVKKSLENDKISPNHSLSERIVPDNIELTKPLSDNLGKKMRSKANWSTNGVAVVNQVVKTSPIPAPIALKEVIIPQLIEEPIQFNLKIESNVFLALKSQLTEGLYDKFINTIHLHQKCIISYQELVKMNEFIMLNVDKDICLALKEIIETRSRAMIAENMFGMKYSKIQNDPSPQNNSYYKIDVPFTNESPSDPLINKQYIGIARGNESAVNFDEPIANRTHKNLSEENLFKIEDEMHEIDSNLIQLQISLQYIQQIAAKNLPIVQIDKICHKLSNVRSLHVLYGSKSPQILDQIKKNEKVIIELVEKRLKEKIALLKENKRLLQQLSWNDRLSNNYYKALDARSNSIKIAERTFLNNKNLIEKLKNSNQNSSQINNWLGKFIPNRLAPQLTTEAIQNSTGCCWNPVICVAFQDIEILSDIFLLIRVYIKQSKLNHAEKAKSINFLDKILGGFFDIPKNLVFNVKPIAEQAINSILHELEKKLYPEKEFYYSDKIKLKINNDNFKLMSDFNLLKLDDSDNKSEIHLPSVNNNSGIEHSPLKDQLQSEKDDINFDNSDISSHFNDLIKSNDSEEDGGKEMNIEQIECDNASRIFYASYHFYIIYQYFIFLYERFQFAFAFALSSTAGIKLYEIFKQLVFMNIFGILDENNFEDSVRMIFDSNSGIFLNFERILQNCQKHVPSDEFSNFILSINPHVFSDRSGQSSFSESVLFAKTCFKLNEMNNRDTKNYKTNVFSAFYNNNNLSGNELVKFEFNKSLNLFLIHKVKSIFSESRRDLSSNLHVIENSYPILTRQMPPISKKAHKTKKLVTNNLTYCLELKKRVLEVKSGEDDDLQVGPFPLSQLEKRKHKILKLNKVKKFRELMSNFTMGGL